MAISFNSITDDSLVITEDSVEKKINFDKIKWIKSSVEVNVSKALNLCIASIILFGSLSFLNYYYHLSERQVSKQNEEWIIQYPSGKEVIQIGGKGNDIDTIFFQNGNYYYQKQTTRFFIYEILLLPLLFSYIIFFGRYNLYNKHRKENSHVIELGVQYGDDFKRIDIQTGDEDSTWNLLLKIRENNERVKLQ
jgi:hypothetical protein